MGDYSPILEPSILERISTLEQKIDSYDEEVTESSPDTGGVRFDSLVDTADEVYHTGAMILEVLCRDSHIGVKSPNFVEIHALAEEVGLPYPLVYDFVGNLVEYPGADLVKWDSMAKKANASREDAYNVYVDSRGLKGPSRE